MCRRLPIFPGRFQPSIFGASELNFRVRNGNGWTLTAINTDLCILTDFSAKIKSFMNFSISKLPSQEDFSLGDPYGNRTHVCGVRGRRLNRLTNGPHGTSYSISKPSHKVLIPGAPSGTRTRDPLIKSQLLYQLS